MDTNNTCAFEAEDEISNWIIPLTAATIMDQFSINPISLDDAFSIPAFTKVIEACKINKNHGTHLDQLVSKFKRMILML